MLGFPREGRRYLHNKGTNGLDDISSEKNMFDVDIVYRDYLSFLYAATAGMPYENSVIKEEQYFPLEMMNLKLQHRLLQWRVKRDTSRILTAVLEARSSQVI